MGSGLAGAAAGAALGSVIPVAGTAVGALLGFGGGMLGSWAAHNLADSSGFTAWAKQGLGGALHHFEQPLATAWDGIAGTTDAISAGLGGAGHALAAVGHSGIVGARHALAGPGKKAWHALAGWL